MIKLGPRPQEPSHLSGQTILKKKQELAEKVAAGERPKSADFKSHWLKKDIRDPLWNLHLGKCCYCERKRGLKRESDIEHYRPKSAVSEDEEHPGYWWLAYEWTNYLIPCKPCNETYKKNQFPLLQESSRAFQPDDDLGAERPFLLNPIDDDPESCISYDWGSWIYVKAMGRDDLRRGSRTIEVLGLNDHHLMEERANTLPLLNILHRTMIHMQIQDNQREVERCAAIIRKQTSSKSVFAGFKRAFFKAVGLGEFVAND